MNGSAVIVGVGESAYSRASGVDEAELAIRAVRAALADAGIEPVDVDGLARFAIDTASQFEIARRLGVRALRYVCDSAAGPASAVALLAAASAAIEAGDARIVVCYRAFNGRSRLRPGHLPLATTASGDVLARGPHPFLGEFTAPYGVVAPACGFALWVQAYQHRHAIADADLSAALATLAVRARAYAGRNPRALLRERPLDSAAYHASPFVAGLLRKADLCLESDGACAFVVSAADDPLVREARAVRVLGCVQALSLEYDSFFFDVPDLPPRADPTLLPRLLARHAVGHDDLDVLGLYDACTANVLFDLENLGFCAAGTAVDWVQRASRAINTSGGQLAEVYLQGMNQCIEVVRQLRGDADNQIDGARLGVVVGAGAQAAALLAWAATT